MTGYVDQLVEALRVELQHYGEMLALLDAGEPIHPHRPPPLVARLEALRAQGVAIRDARQQRQHAQSRVAWAAGQPEKESITDLLPEIPTDYQPLLRALHEEIEGLNRSVRQHAQFSQGQLTNAAGELERFIDAIERPAPMIAVPPTPVSGEAQPPREANA